MRLAENAHEKNHAFRLKTHTWGVQFHPEFTEVFMRQYISARPQRIDVEALLAAAQPTPEAAGVLSRFGQYVQHRETAR